MIESADFSERKQPEEIDNKKSKKKTSAWRGLFSFLDKLHIKKALTRMFIFHPPSATYTFKLNNTAGTEEDPVWEFIPKNPQSHQIDTSLKMNAFKIYREKDNKNYITPVLWLHQPKRTNYVLLYSHGNSSDLGTAYYSAVILSSILNMDVVVYDYTGYGISPNRPSEKNLYSDIESVLSFMVNFLNYSLDKVILCGFSLGSGPTVEIATRYKSLPFILLFAPLASCLSVVEGKNSPDKACQNDLFDNFDKMSKLSCGIIFVHGKKDRTIPYQHSKKMFDRFVTTPHKTKQKARLLEVDELDHHQLITELVSPETEYRYYFMKYFEDMMGTRRKKRKESTNSLETKNSKIESNLSKASDASGASDSLKTTAERGEGENGNPNSQNTLENEERKEVPVDEKKLKEIEEKKEKRENLKKDLNQLRNVFLKININKPLNKYQETNEEGTEIQSEVIFI